MFTLNAKDYAVMLKIHKDNRIPMFIYGGPGLGKSMIPRQVFSEDCACDIEAYHEMPPDEKNQVNGRIFAEWGKLTKDEHMHAIEHPEKYFIFVDFRLGQCDSSDLRGIPRLDSEYMEYAPMSWVGYFAKEESDGVIFFDELNLAPPIVSGQCYQIINDRVVSDIKLGPNVFIFGAGNRAEDKAPVFSMPFPLRDRFSEMCLSVDDEIWCEWAINNQINSHIVAYIKWKPTRLYCPPSGTEDKGSTPRGFERASKLINGSGVNITDPLCHSLMSMAVGEAAATEFQAYVKVASKLDFEAMITDPSRVKKAIANEKTGTYNFDKLYAVCGLLGDHFGKIQKIDAQTKHRAGAMFEIAEELPEECTVVALNMMRNSRGSKSMAMFVKAMSMYKNKDALLMKIGKYISMA